MLQKQILTKSWGIGLDAGEMELLRQALGNEHDIVPMVADEFHKGNAADLDPPFVLWVSSRSRFNPADISESMAEKIALAPRVLILGPTYGIEDFEQACDQGFTDFLRPPLSRERISDIMRKALESFAIHHDMECMAREIMLERELLERKHDIMSFLVNFLSNASESLDLTSLLQNAHESLGQLIPMQGMHAVFWDQEVNETPRLSLFINAREGSPAYQAWRETLLEHARTTLDSAVGCTEIIPLVLRGGKNKAESCMPDSGAVISVPLACGSEHLGILLLSTTLEKHLGRDQAVALDSAMRSFAVSVKNALRFQQMQMYADYDALTKVHSRRHFEGRLVKEMDRFRRYGQALSLVMLDIDHFKRINDTYGHHVGDIVLKETGGIIAECIRGIDYCARYGGEEFAILLPHTEKKQAHAIAERIRKSIAEHTYFVEGGAPLCITVSLGLSTLLPGEEKNKQALICEADAALYKAKQSGRNRTCTSPLSVAGVKTG